MVTLYVLKGKIGKRYVGITNDLPRRINEHRLKNLKAGQLLDEFSVLPTENFSNYKSAREGEKFLKSGQGRKWLDELDPGGPQKEDKTIPPGGLYASGVFKSLRPNQ